MRTIGLAQIWAGIVFVGGCSQVLDWDDPGNNQGCVLPNTHESGRRCKEGYSCLGEKCIKHGTLPPGETCNQHQQCESGLVCIEWGCRRPCQDFLEPTASCDDGSYCAVGFDIKELTNTGGCVPSMCEKDIDCVKEHQKSDQHVCVPITATANACLPGCKIEWTTAGNYREEKDFRCDHNTDTTSDDASKKPTEVCQPIGYGEDAQRLVCIKTKVEGTQSLGKSCEPVSDPCKDGLRETEKVGFLCSGGTCNRYCDPKATPDPCQGSGSCCELTLGDGSSYGVCLSSCPP